MTAAPEIGEQKISTEVKGEPFPSRTLHQKDWSIVTPAVLVRVGVIKNIDVGARVGYASGVDAKARVLDSHWVALAVDPAVRAGKLGMFDLPLIASLKIHDSFELVAAPGIAFLVPSLGGRSEPGFERVHSSLARLSLGVRLGLARDFFVHPEVTTFRSIAGSDFTWNGAGLGFSLEMKP